MKSKVRINELVDSLRDRHEKTFGTPLTLPGFKLWVDEDIMRRKKALTQNRLEHLTDEEMILLKEILTGDES